MRNKKFRRMTAVITAGVLLLAAAMPVYAAAGAGGAANNAEAPEAGTDRVTYKADPSGNTESGANKAGTRSSSAGTADPVPGKENRTSEKDAEAEKEPSEKGSGSESESGPTVTVTVSVEDILNYLLPEEKETAQTGTVKGCSLLNIRSGAGTENAVVGQLKAGDQVRVTGSDGEWVRITVPEKSGYVYSRYLEVIESVSSDPSVSREELLQILMFLLENMDKEQQPSGLTPDGNMNLVDDIGPVTGEGQQFITVTSKNGNYFYLIIDRDDQGNENVHFLNMVDERDLLDLMDDEEAEYYENLIAEKRDAGPGAKNTEKKTEETCDEKVEQATEETVPVEKESGSETPPASAGSGKVKTVMVMILLAALGGCGVWIVKKMKTGRVKKQKEEDPDEEDAEEEMQIPEDTDETGEQ